MWVISDKECCKLINALLSAMFTSHDLDVNKRKDYGRTFPEKTNVTYCYYYIESGLPTHDMQSV